MTKARDLASSTLVPSTVSATELGYVDGVTSAIQTQVDSKLGTSTAASTYQTKAANGLVLLSTANFSGVPSVALPANTFSSTYTNYHVKVIVTTTANATVSARLRASGSDISTANYDTRGFYVGFSSTLTRVVTTSATGWDLISLNTNKAVLNFEMSQPNVAAFKINFAKMYSSSSGDMVDYCIPFSTTTVADSMTVYANTGNISGSISCYGYNL